MEINIMIKDIIDNMFSDIQDVAVLGCDKNQHITYWNNTCQNTFGFTSNEALGKCIKDLIIPSDLIKDFDHIFSNLFIKEIAPPSGEYILKSKDNVPVYLFSSFIYVTKDNGKKELFSINFDISKRKRTEKLQNVLQTVTQAVNNIYDLEKLIVVVKKELNAIIDTTHFYISLYNADNNSIQVPYLRDKKIKFEFVPIGLSLSSYVLKTKQPLLAKRDKLLDLLNSGEIKMLEPGLKIWVGVPLIIKHKLIGVLAVQNFKDENAYSYEDLKFLTVISHEISVAIQRIKMENDLRDALTKARESDRLKSAFLANMSHEIRTPMNGILGFMELLSQPDITHEYIQMYTQIINESGQRLLHTINDIIDISKIESGQIQVHLKEMDINALLVQLNSFFKSEALSKNLTLILDNQISNEEFIIISDNIKLESILTNLIKNAIKFTDSGKIVFGYNLSKTEVTFYVEDTGIGIETERLNAIFNRFEQADIEDEKAHQGSGLGLTISKSYTEMLDGKIWVESNIGKGSKFYVSIPLITPQNYAAIRQKNLKKEKSQPNILIIESPNDKITFLEEVLNGFADTLSIIESSDEALKMIRCSSDYDIIIVDNKSNKYNALHEINQIRKLNKSILIFLITDDLEPEQKDLLINSGCDGFIINPIKAVDL